MKKAARTGVFDVREVLAAMDGETFKSGRDFRARVAELCEPHLHNLPADVCSVDVAALIQKHGWVSSCEHEIRIRIPERASRPGLA